MRHLPWLLLILLLATATRLYQLETQSIWFDEGWSAYAAIQPTLQAAADADLTNPPLYYALLNAYARWTGDSEFNLRWFSALWGLIVIALCYQLGRETFDERAGLAAAMLAAFNPLLWWASQEARMYTLLAALVLVCALFWQRLMKASHLSVRALLPLLLAELALLYAHNTGPVIVLWLNGVTLLAWLMRRVTGGSAVRFWVTWLGGQAVVGLLWLPYFVNRFLLLPEANSAINRAPAISLDLLAQMWGAVWIGVWSMVGAVPLLVMLALVIFGLSVISFTWRSAGARWLLLHIGLLTGGLWLGLALLGNDLHGRYLVMIAPLLLVALGGAYAGSGIVQGHRGGSRTAPTGQFRFRDVRPLSFFASAFTRLGSTLLLLIVPVNLLLVMHTLTTTPTYQHDDARGMAAYYARTLGADDTVLMWSYADRYELAYYWSRQGVTARRVTLPEGADLEAIAPLLPTSGDVALNVWYTQRADFRGMMGCVLGAGTRDEPENYDVVGMTDRLFRQPGLHLPGLRPFTAELSGASLTGVGELPFETADRALCLPLQLTLTQPGSADYKVAVSIYNERGWEVARTDAIFADAAQRTASLLEAGATVTAYPLLRLPVGAPAGDYSLRVRLYDEQAQPNGYELRVPGEAARRDALVGIWTVQAADWSTVGRQTTLPVPVDHRLSDDLTLVAHDAQAYPLRNGDRLRLALLWDGTADLPALTLADADGRWAVAIAADYPAGAGLRLDWREGQVPLAAPAGRAELRLPDGTVLATYPVESIPLVTDIPSVDYRVGLSLPGVGEIIGYTLEGDPAARQPFTVTLIWRAEAATTTSYTVFVQLVTNDGRVLAQSDRLPVEGSRPTTGWRAGEVLIDSHTLTFNDGVDGGTARLIAGMYDALTGARLPAADGADFIVLQSEIAIP